MMKHTHGLRLVRATRINVTNHNASEPSISVNGAQLSYRDLDLGSLQITNNKVYALDETDSQYYEVIHANSDIQIKFQEDEGEPAKIQRGQIVPAGDNLYKQQSPAPFCYIDTTGRLASSNLWRNLFVANVMGYVDVDKASSTYNHGLVPAGSATHDGLFLRKDGQWGQPSVHTGSVSESFLSLNDTPITYTENVDKYLRVSYAEGGSLVFDSINTAKVPEDTNLYHTEARVDSRITTKLQDRSLANIAVSGTITCNEVLAESDARLKEDVADLESEACLATIDRIQPKSYFFKGRKGRRYGIIAQEIEATLPEVVKYTNGQASVNYLELVPFLIGSIKHLKAELHDLKYELYIHQPTNPPIP
jgi:hypothetical protein